ncbi:MAG TPA: AGE family epimerase/isomerase [Candidatus Limnocylindria bacterium]|nr:AGE family epimerase/isomerase [Candidatus Limnocylindria bacterium]
MSPIKRLAVRLAIVALAALAGRSPSHAAELATEAAHYRQMLAEKILPYWYDTTVDWERGGYLLSDDAVRGRSVPNEKLIATQARMISTFSLVHRKGFSTAQRDYLKAAANGVKFLRAHFRDPEQGGYFWSVTLDGKPRDTHKRLFGQSFVIYALVEYSRASGDRAALEDALQLYREIQRHAHDASHGGWREQFTRGWQPLAEGDPEAVLDPAGAKGANTHLHLMEALAELYDETNDATVKESLAESLAVNRRYFFPEDAAQAAIHFSPGWRRLSGPKSEGLNYGSNVEFAWLMVQAEEALGQRPSWPQFHGYLMHTLRNGTDQKLGGVYHHGVGNQPATDTAKAWWAQAEMFAALSEGLRNQPNNAAYTVALGKLITFVNKYQADPKSGIWLESVKADGTPLATGLAGNWKANYHEVRGLLKFVETFEQK